ncbi:MAG: hypothetical protein ACHQFW_07060 [Chitinophagales bacterium]
MKHKLLPVIFSLSIIITSCAQSSKETVSIGSRQFVITIQENGKPETAVSEQVVFADSMFDDIQCHQWGFTAGKYTATKTGDDYNFEATMDGSNEGKMIFTGMIMGKAIHGNMVWKKEGQGDINYEFKGTEGMLPAKTQISLDGKIYVTTTMEHGKPETAYNEDWTFDGGTLRSPSCEEYGFSKSPYKAWEQEGIITMESHFPSEKEGHMNFTATIKGENLTGNVLWHKEGQNDILYDVTGELKK